MNNNIKKTLVAIMATTLALGTFAAPHGKPHHGGGHGPAPRIHHTPPPPAQRHHHGGGAWGRGGRNILPGFVGGVIGGVVGATVVQPATTIIQPAPVVVHAPVATQVQNIWVNGRYVDQVQANGTVIRVWQPGHYEQRTVVVQ